jgi:hypothetical protein
MTECTGRNRPQRLLRVAEQTGFRLTTPRY